MTEAQPSQPDPHLEDVAHWHPIEGTPEKKRVAIGCSVGATIETYDFIGFGTAAALYFNTVFFPASDPLSGTLLSFATLGIGFAVRPLGGIIGGLWGTNRPQAGSGRLPVPDGLRHRIDRSAAHLPDGWHLGTDPAGDRPGGAGPGVRRGVGRRDPDGFEHAPWRKRGLYTGITQAGFPVGLLLANLAFLASVPLGDQWAWRVPFLLSAVLIVVGITIRLKIDESPEFEELKEEGQLSKNPILEVMRDDWRNVLRAFCLRTAETAGYAVSVTFMLSYLTREIGRPRHHLDRPHAGGRHRDSRYVCWGALTDRIGRRPVYLLGTAITLLWGVPLFLTVNTGARLAIILAFIISYAVCQNSLAGVQGAWFSELFSAKTRTSGASMAYQLSAVVSGFTPLIATALYSRTGWIGPALLFSCYGLLGLIAATMTRETWGPAERRTWRSSNARSCASGRQVRASFPKVRRGRTGWKPKRPSSEEGSKS